LETIAVSVPKREEEEIDPVHTGKVDMFNNSRGFGFIRETEQRPVLRSCQWLAGIHHGR
jgi:hypothetical protein